MGSPYETFRSNRIHAVTSSRGATMILRKILVSTGEVVFSPELDRLLSNVVEATVRNPECFTAFWYSDEDWSVRDDLWKHIPYNTTALVSEYLQALVDNVVGKTSVTFVCTARYEWPNWSKFQCVVFFSLHRKG